MADKKQGSGEEPSMEEILSSIRQIISEESGGSGASGGSAAAEPAAGEDEDVLELTEEVAESDDSGSDHSGGEDEADVLGAGDDSGPPDFGGPDDDDEADDGPLGGDTGMSDPFEAIGGRAPADEPAGEIDDGPTAEPEPEPEPEPQPSPEPDPEPVPEPEPAPREPEPAGAAAAAAPPSGADSDADGGWVSPEPAQQATASLEQLAEASRKAEFGEAPKSDSDKILENMVREALRPQVKAWLDENLPGLVERIVREEVRRMTRKAEAAADPGDDEESY